MLEKDFQIISKKNLKDIHEEVEDLQERFAAISKDLKDGETKLSEKNSELKQDTEKLKVLTRKKLSNEKNKNYTQDDIFLYKRKISRIGDDVKSVGKKLQSAEIEIQNLLKVKSELNKNTDKIQSMVTENNYEFNILEDKIKEQRSAVEKSEIEKEKLSKDISEILSHAFVEKEQVDTQLAEIAEKLSKITIDRAEIKDVFAERQTLISDISDQVEMLEEEYSIIQERIELKEKKEKLITEVENLDDEAILSKKKKESAQKKLMDAEAELKSLLLSNSEKIEGISILKRDVAMYEKAVRSFGDAEKELKNSRDLTNQVLLDLDRLLNENIYLVNIR
jgi:chromosome segregation ATPase